jgi:hypothetical protein
MYDLEGHFEVHFWFFSSSNGDNLSRQRKDAGAFFMVEFAATRFPRDGSIVLLLAALGTKECYILGQDLLREQFGENYYGKTRMRLLFHGSLFLDLMAHSSFG